MWNILHLCAPESPDLEALLRVHEEVSPQVIKHDCGFLVILRVLAPDHPQRLHINNPILLGLNRDHCSGVQVEGEVVVWILVTAKQLHLLLNPPHVGC